MPKTKILIADDDSSITEGLSELLQLAGYDTVTVNQSNQALKLLLSGKFSVGLIDLMMPRMTGLDLLRKCKAENVLTEIIIITGKGSVTTAVQAMKEGAYDYLAKPVEPDRIRSLVPKAVERYQLVVGNRSLKSKAERLEETLKHMSTFEDMIGEHERIHAVFRTIDAVAGTTASILISGESGTGKELVAKAVHRKSPRKDGPFIAVNCSALPRDILENELFGHEKGAFTGAVKEKIGCFEMADNGTLFLDEIGEMPVDTQAKLLRVLEEHSFRRLGGSTEVRVDVRVVAATNRDPQEAMRQGTLREDLYFRLSVMEIDMPPLRERNSDVPLLAAAFLKNSNKKNGKAITGFSDRANAALMSYLWPGNIRELKNAVERAVILCNESQIGLEYLPRQMLSLDAGSSVSEIQINRPLQEIERDVIFRTLEQTNNNKTKAAKVLGISLKTLHNKLNKYFLD